MDEIRIHGLALHCIVGIHAHERVTEQPLCLDLTLGLDTREAARTGKIGRTVHYGEVAEQVSALLRFRRYRLLEGAAEEVAWMLLGIHSRLEWVKIQVRKPQALEGLAETASLTIRRTREDLRQAEQATPRSSMVEGLTVHHHVAMREAELAVINLKPHQRWQPVNPQRSQWVWVLSGMLCVDGRVLSSGQHLCEERSGAWRDVVALNEAARVFLCHAQIEHG